MTSPYKLKIHNLSLFSNPSFCERQIQRFLISNMNLSELRRAEKTKNCIKENTPRKKYAGLSDQAHSLNYILGIYSLTQS